MTNKQRQNLLAYLGYYVGDIDGDWGSGSREACRAFQRAYNDISDKDISVDGYGGPETDKALKKAVADDLFKTEPVNQPETGVYWDHIRYWSREEFRCRCGEYHAPYCNGFPVEPNQTLVELVDDIRHEVGEPCYPSSGIRCEQHNADQPNAAANSMHKVGKALDFRARTKSAQEVLAIAKRDPRMNYAYIIGNGPYVHVDVK